MHKKSKKAERTVEVMEILKEVATLKFQRDILDDYDVSYRESNSLLKKLCKRYDFNIKDLASKLTHDDLIKIMFDATIARWSEKSAGNEMISQMKDRLREETYREDQDILFDPATLDFYEPDRPYEEIDVQKIKGNLVCVSTKE